MKMQSSKQVRKFVICNSLLVTLYLSLFTCSVFAESSAGVVKNANKLYENKKYDDALREYNKALTKSPDSAVINFDIGAAQYKKGDYEKALGSFTKALISEEGKLESKTNYNIGNSKYKQGVLEENTNLSSAISLLKDSLDYYKRVIELDEKNKDAKFNHEFVEKKLKVLLDKQKQQQKQKQDKKKEGKKKDKGEQGKEKQQKQKAEKNKEKEKQEAGDKEKEKRKEEQGEREKDKGEMEKGKEEQKQKAEKSREMSEKEAKMLLEGYRHEEELKDKLKKTRQQGYYSEVLKDW